MYYVKPVNGYGPFPRLRGGGKNGREGREKFPAAFFSTLPYGIFQVLYEPL